MRSMIVRALLLVAAVCVLSPAPAQDDRPRALYGHAWLVYRDEIPESGRTPAGVDTIVLHAPPRLAPEEKSRGVLGFAPAFPTGVDAAAWHRNEVYFVMAAEHRTGNGSVRPAARLRAWRTLVDTFEFTPAKAENLPPIWGEVSVIGLAASETGVLALLRQADRVPEASMTPMSRVGSPGELMLRVLGDEAWSEASVPAALAELSILSEQEVRASVFVVAQRGGLGVLVARPGNNRATLLVGGPERLSDDVFGPPALTVWTSVELPMSGGEAGLNGACFVRGWTAADDALIGWTVEAGVVRLKKLSSEGSTALATIEVTDERASGSAGVQIVPMASPAAGSPGRVVVSWGQPPSVRPAARDPGGDGTGAKSARTPIELREVSIVTGDVLFAGPARNFELVSVRSLQLLAAALLVMMVAVILFVVRAEPGKAPELPAELQLAGLVRRATAWLIDYALAALLAAPILGLPALSLVRLSQLVQMDATLMGLGLALLIAMGQSVLTEALWGRSLGKFAMGLRVYSTMSPAVGGDGGAPEGETRAGPPVFGSPRLWQVVLRNLVRWTVPVVGLLALIDGGRRHPGDLLARTIVLSAREEEPEAPET